MAKQKKRTPRKNKKSKTARRKKNSFLSLRTMGRVACKWALVAAIWLVIAAGLLTAWYAADLPNIIDQPHFERINAVTVLDGEGGTITRYGELKGLSVTVDELPPHLIYAVLAIEDRRFYSHFGLDPLGVARAVTVNLARGRVAQGGSTITQQLAKNLFLSHERTFRRKIQEALLALWLERQLTKDEILSAYLNRVYLGAGTYGMDAAARTYFNKPATEVTLYESALLAGLLRAPSRYSPQSNPGLAAQRARVVLSAMKESGYIDDHEATQLSRLTPTPARKPGEGRAAHYYSDWVISTLDELIGTTDNDLIITTTLDPYIQNVAETALYKALRENAARNVSQGAVVVMRTDGAVLAMIGGRNYTASQFNRATQARRPPGSAFKPFVFLAALQQGRTPHDMIEDVPIENGQYQPSNFNDEYYGQVTLEQALARSMNTASIRLAQETGLRAVIDNARKAGISAALPHDMSIALGSAGVPLLEMATAYASFSNGGLRVTPHAIESITGADDTLIYMRRPPIARQIFSERDIKALNIMMVSVLENGTGRGAALPWYAAGKTGTSQDYRDAWFIGYTDHLITAVWLGNDDNSPMNQVTGGNLPAQIWREIMSAAHPHEQAKGSPPLSRFSGRRGQDGSFSGLISRLLSFGDSEAPQNDHTGEAYNNFND